MLYAINGATMERGIGKGIAGVSLEYMGAACRAGVSGTFLAEGDLTRGAFAIVGPAAFTVVAMQGIRHPQYALDLDSVEFVGPRNRRTADVMRWAKIDSAEAVPAALARVRESLRRVAGANSKAPRFAREAATIAACLGDASALPEAVRTMAAILDTPEGSAERAWWKAARAEMRAAGFRVTL